MKTLKLFQLAIVIVVLLTANLFAQVQFKAYVKNQEVVLNDPAYAGANTVYFDVYLQQNGGTGPLYLANSDFKFTFNFGNFTILNGTDDFQMVYGSAVLYNSNNAIISPETSPTYQASTHLLIINFAAYVPGSQPGFNANVAKIDETLDKHKLGRFVVKTIINTSGTFGLAWSPETIVTSYTPVSPWLSEPATGTYEVINNQPLPVELASFTANISIRDVSLNWRTVKETNNKGFEIERKKTDEEWTKVGYIDGKGTTNTETAYNFDDKKLNSGKYNYRLKQVDYNGNFEYHSLNTVIEVGLPTKFDLSQNYPNPFNPTTKIDYQLPADGKVSIRIYDVTGREVKTLINNEQRTAGYYTIDFNGGSMASGIYFYRFIAESNSKQTVMTKKMVLVK